MNPQPPVTKMRTAPSNSVGAGPLADFPMLGDPLAKWRATIAETGWTPWLILALAIFLRFFLLGIKPPHFDEGINGWFVDQMVKNGFYRYDPTNYHGPLHFYVLFLSQTLLGRNIWALRLPVVVVSCACVWLALKFEVFVGRTPARIAALAMAVSPGFIFYGRYSIHEVWMQFFSMLLIFGGFGLWKFGTRNYLWCTGMAVTGMILTKETYIIHIGCALIAIAAVRLSAFTSRLFGRTQRNLIVFLLGCLLIVFFSIPWVDVWNRNVYALEGAGFVLHGPYVWLLPIFGCAAIAWALSSKDCRVFAGLLALIWLTICAVVCTTLTLISDSHLLIGSKITVVLSALLFLVSLIPPNSAFADERRPKQSWDYVDLAMVIAAGAGLLVFFYSGTFFHWSGVKGLYQAYAPWFSTGSEGHGHEKPWYYWLKVMAPSFDWSRADCLGYELPALAGLILCFFSLRFKSINLRYLAIYGIGTFFIYSYVNYKTPWCIISFIWPFLFVFGAASTIISASYQKLVTNISAVLVSISFGSSIWLNYFHCTTDTEPYAYVQTCNDIYKLTDPVLALAHHDPFFYQMVGHIIRTSAYPLPWILDDFPRVGYYEHNNTPTTVDADFLLVQEDRVEEIEAKLHDSYFIDFLRIRSYQDSSKLYLSVRTFKGFFPGRAPDFVGKPAAPAKQ
jgi:predicted membrane-bound mannosyltransferase